MGIQVVSQVATAVTVIAGAVMLLGKAPAGGGPRCPTCNGSGRVPCLCSRWSDGDVGCSSCSGSGLTLCRSCGGRGTGRPLPAASTVVNFRPNKSHPHSSISTKLV